MCFVCVWRDCERVEIKCSLLLTYSSNPSPQTNSVCMCCVYLIIAAFSSSSNHKENALANHATQEVSQQISNGIQLSWDVQIKQNFCVSGFWISCETFKIIRKAGNVQSLLHDGGFPNLEWKMYWSRVCFLLSLFLIFQKENWLWEFCVSFSCEKISFIVSC